VRGGAMTPLGALARRNQRRRGDQLALYGGAKKKISAINEQYGGAKQRRGVAA